MLRIANELASKGTKILVITPSRSITRRLREQSPGIDFQEKHPEGAKYDVVFLMKPITNAPLAAATGDGDASQTQEAQESARG